MAAEQLAPARHALARAHLVGREPKRGATLCRWHVGTARSARPLRRAHTCGGWLAPERHLPNPMAGPLRLPSSHLRMPPSRSGERLIYCWEIADYSLATAARSRWPDVQFLFGNHVLDLDRRELRSGSELIATEPQVFDILVLLLQNHDRVVSKHELVDEVWGGRIVSESTVSSRITAVRKAVGDDGKQQRLIRTLPRRGLRFVGAVRQVPAPAPSAMPFSPRGIAASKPTRRAVAMPDQPAIAVLPFVNWSGDPRQDCFAGGMTEEITTGLSRLHWLSVIACNSSSDHVGKPADTRQLASELGVRYVVEGSIWAVGESIRVSSRLIDTENGRHIWAEKYDRRLDDVFLVQRRIRESRVDAVDSARNALK